MLDYRLELFAKEKHPILEAKAVWSWAKNEEEHPPSTLEIFEIYHTSRSDMLAKLESLPLDEADELDDGDPVELGSQYLALHRKMEKLNILGGCCGTDHRHMEEICKAFVPNLVRPPFPGVA